MYKQAPGRMNMPKTGRGIPSALPMSPLSKFPVKPGMKLESFENILDKKTGNLLTRDQASQLLSSPTGTDLSQYEGVTNVSQLLNTGQEGVANVNRRVSRGARTTESNTTAYPRVDLSEGSNTIVSERGNIVGSRNVGGRRGEAHTDRTMSQLQNLATSRNYLNTPRSEMVSPHPNLGNIAILEKDAARTTAPSGADIYTTARVTGQQDIDYLPNIISSAGTVRQQASREKATNLTQRNMNFPKAFTQADIQSSISENPNQFFATGSMSQRPMGNIPSLQNVQDDYAHQDRQGYLQAPPTPSGAPSQTPRGRLSQMHKRRNKR